MHKMHVFNCHSCSISYRNQQTEVASHWTTTSDRIKRLALRSMPVFGRDRQCDGARRAGRGVPNSGVCGRHAAWPRDAGQTYRRVTVRCPVNVSVLKLKTGDWRGASARGKCDEKWMACWNVAVVSVPRYDDSRDNAVDLGLTILMKRHVSNFLGLAQFHSISHIERFRSLLEK